MTDLEFIMEYKGGEEEMSEEQLIAGFQQLIDSGLVWQLQGHYGRTAHELIKEGVCHYAE